METKKLKIKINCSHLADRNMRECKTVWPNSEVTFLLMALACKSQTDADSTGGNGYGQPQSAAERCDVAIPCHVGLLR